MINKSEKKIVERAIYITAIVQKLHGNLKGNDSFLCDTSQEYPTEPLDKIPARQAEFELAGKKKHWLVSWLGNLNERLAS